MAGTLTCWSPNLPDVQRPLYSPDGKTLAFISLTTGNGDIYTVSLESGALKRLTYDDAADKLDAWSADGSTIYFSTAGHNVGTNTNDIYSVGVNGGTPLPAVAEKYQNLFYAAPHPDGHTIAFCANGLASSQWWRHGRSHDDECELWTTDGHSHFARLTDYGAKNLWPSYSPDGRTLYFMSDRDGPENIWSLATVSTTTAPTSQPIVEPKRITAFHDGRVLWPTLSRDGTTMVFERELGIWKLNFSTGQAAPVPIHLRGIVAEPAIAHSTLSKNISEFSVSHDGKKIAFVVEGQVFAGLAGGGGTPFRVTHTNAVESHVTWANDDRRLAYVSTRDGPRHVYLYDFGDHTENRLTNSPGNDSLPLFSPGDAMLAFVRDGKELRVIDLHPNSRATNWLHLRNTNRLLAGNLSFDRPPFDLDGTPFVWSSAGDWIACVAGGAKGFRNLNVIPSDGSAAARQISFLANAENTSVAWTPDGTSLYFRQRPAY